MRYAEGKTMSMCHRPQSLALGVLMLCLAACGQQSSDTIAPDLILVNAHVVTMDAADSIAQAIAVRGDRITAVGTEQMIRPLAGPQTELIDVGGNTVTPGLIDTHNHFAWGALGKTSPLNIEYPAVTSIEDIKEQVRLAAANLKSGEWIIGSRWDAGKLLEQRDLTAADLDDVSPDNPVWLLHTSAHYGVANTKALELAGIDAGTPDPNGGVIARDDEGNPSGILADQAMALVADLTPPVSVEDFVRAVSERVGFLNAEGITTIKDPEIDQRHWDAYKTINENGDLSVRVFALWRVPDTMAEARELLQHIRPIMNRGGDAVDLISGGIKIYIDGSGTARTAWMYDDWNENFTDVDEGNTGLTYLETDLLLAQIRLFHDAGVHIGTHAIGDRAIDFTLDSYDRVLTDKPTMSLRHSIIHCNLPTAHAMDLMVKLQRDYDAAYPEVQPAFLWWIGDVYAGNFGAERSRQVLPLRTFQERGIKWAGSSDFDVSPYAPRYALWAASAREAMLGTYGENPWGTDESISVHDTLRAYTINAARQVFLEQKVGSIEEGKLADIVVWDRDLYSIPVSELKEVKPVLTLMNGEVVYRASN
ncbi:MAG: hypothetical protein DRR11_07830 [Gammaproteobacteria bacterium]|nr:MAG: hypothetical protein DRR11_07830 [Gammaproteobacteria bacterium]